MKGLAAHLGCCNWVKDPMICAQFSCVAPPATRCTLSARCSCFGSCRCAPAPFGRQIPTGSDSRCGCNGVLCTLRVQSIAALSPTCQPNASHITPFALCCRAASPCLQSTASFRPLPGSAPPHGLYSLKHHSVLCFPQSAPLPPRIPFFPVQVLGGKLWVEHWGPMEWGHYPAQLGRGWVSAKGRLPYAILAIMDVLHAFPGERPVAGGHSVDWLGGPSVQGTAGTAGRGRAVRLAIAF